jgi:hypothetical protein
VIDGVAKRISVFGDLLDGEEDRNAEDVAEQGHIISRHSPDRLGFDRKSAPASRF